MLDSVAEAWSAVAEDTVARSFRGCGISNTLDGSEEGDLHDGLADVGARAPGDQGELKQNAANFFFATDPQESFEGFERND